MRSVPLATLKKLNSKTMTTFSIGTVFCFKHLKDSTMECSQNGVTDSILVEQINQNAYHEKDDVDYEPDEIPQTERSLNMADEALMSIHGLDKNPLSFQVKRNPVDELS